MANDNKPSGLNPNSAIIVAILATGALWFARPAPLETARPAPSGKHVEARFDDQDVEARLWQDPLETIAREIEKAGGKTPNACASQKNGPEKTPAPHCRSPFVDERGKEIAGVETTMAIAVMVPGASYFEDSEARRRLRYAVLSGLLSERFTPADAQHIGYFRPRDYQRNGLPEAIPYEIFRNDGNGRSIVLFWIDEDIFKGAGARDGGGLRRLVALRETLCPQEKCPKGPKFSILGPWTTDAARNLPSASGEFLVSRNGANAKDKPLRPLDLAIYSYSVTGRPAGAPEATARSNGEQVQKLDVDFFPTIARDDTVASALVKELALRGFGEDSANPSRRQAAPHVALVSDFDTEYGRAIVRDFGAALKAHFCPPEAGNQDCAQREPITLTYLRGLDGMLPAKEEKTGKDKDQKVAASPAAPLENAFGPGQFDYLRRLAAGLQARDDAIWLRDHARIKAIGILGNDVFDKLLALRALRPLFPEALFFTTDFDHALATPNETKWSRNLLIASGYGPTLALNWQGSVPPFRNAYQTSAFVAARLAADEFGGCNEVKRRAISDATGQPQIFEIDRDGVIMRLPARRDAQATRPDASFCPGRLQNASVVDSDKIRVQPNAAPIAPQIDKFAQRGWFLLSLIGGSAILFLAYRGLLWPYLRTTWIGLAVCFFALAGVGWFWNELARWATDGGYGEPIAGMRGISVWPTIALRAIGTVGAFCMTIDAWFCLTRNLDVTVTKETLFLQESSGVVQPQAPGFIDVTPEWDDYLRRSSLRSVATRVTLCVLVALVVFYCLMSIFGSPNVPWRGPRLEVYQITTLALVLLMLTLTFLVVDATLLCLRFVIFLRDHRTRWMSATRAAYARDLGFGLDDPLLDDWIDLSFIAARTSCIGNLIYMPFALSVLLIVSRSTVFANYAPSPPILLMQGICIVILFVCALMLCASAEQAREIAKRRLSEALLLARTTGTPATTARLDGVSRLVEGLNRGSFVPLSQQPPVRALMLPLGGLGWTALLDYRLLPGL